MSMPSSLAQRAYLRSQTRTGEAFQGKSVGGKGEGGGAGAIGQEHQPTSGRQGERAPVGG